MSNRQGRRISLLGPAAAVAALALSSLPAGQAGEVSGPLAELEPLHRFHVDDFGLDCQDCHSTAETPAPGYELSYSVRPGHSNCDVCHTEVFEAGELVPFCMVCHTGEVFDFSPFPSGRVSISRFSHALHLDPKERVASDTGVRRDCLFCHQAEAQPETVSLPGHFQCLSCHNSRQAVEPFISETAGSAGCAGCHNLARMDRNLVAEAASEPSSSLPVPIRPRSARPASYRDVVPFSHTVHRQNRDGSFIDCTLCHQSVLAKTELQNASRIPSMRDCTACHDLAGRVGHQSLTGRCETCHSSITRDLRPGPDQVVAAVAHTASFLRAHQLQARRPDAYCGYCHDMPGSGPMSCAACHQSMKPQSHLAARFSETTHGRLAAFDRGSCATCHAVDFCSDCHNIPPRSHTPLPLFAGGGLHRQLAALNLRSCFTCHSFEESCSQCHSNILRPPD